MNLLSTSELLAGSMQLVISIFSGIGLLSIYYQISRRVVPTDKGIYYFAMIAFSWALLGAWSFFNSCSIFSNCYLIVKEGISIWNNALFMLAISHIELDKVESFKSWLEGFLKRKFSISTPPLISIKRIVLGLTSIVFALVIWEVARGGPDEETLSELVVSLISIVIFGIVMFLVFIDRKLSLIPWIMVLPSTLILFIAQIYFYYHEAEVVDGSSVANTIVFFKIVSKSYYYMVFFILATTWVHRRKRLPIPSEMKLTLMIRKTEEIVEPLYVILLTIPPFVKRAELVLPKSQKNRFRLLLKYALIKVNKINQGYLRFDEPFGKDFHSQANSDNILKSINSQLAESEQLETTQFFEKLHGKGRRLRIDRENITVDMDSISQFKPQWDKDLKELLERLEKN